MDDLVLGQADLCPQLPRAANVLAHLCLHPSPMLSRAKDCASQERISTPTSWWSPTPFGGSSPRGAGLAPSKIPQRCRPPKLRQFGESKHHPQPIRIRDRPGELLERSQVKPVIQRILAAPARPGESRK